MKVLYITDTHSAFDKFEIVCEYAEESKPDLIAVSGDIVNAAYKDLEYMRKHQFLAKIIWDYAVHTEPGLRRLTPFEVKRIPPIVAEKIYENPPNKKLEELAEEYLHSLDFLEGNMDLQYDLLKSMLDKLGIGYKALSGNHDKELQMTSLKEEDWHKKTIEKNGIKISAFGGANDIKHGDVIPPWTPVEITMPFNEYINSSGKTVSEIFNFLNKEKPDIAFTHIPPKSMRDLTLHPQIRRLQDSQLQALLKEQGPALLAYVLEEPQLRQYLKEGGSPGLLEYLKQGHTKILCCGHIHESVGAAKLKTENGPVIIFNGGSLKQGYFAEIFIDDKTKKLDKIALYQIKGKLLLPGHLKESLDVNNIKLLMEYFLTLDDELKKVKTDLNDPFEY